MLSILIELTGKTNNRLNIFLIIDTTIPDTGFPSEWAVSLNWLSIDFQHTFKHQMGFQYIRVRKIIKNTDVIMARVPVWKYAYTVIDR